MEKNIGKAGGIAVSVTAPETFESNDEYGIIFRGGEGPRPPIEAHEARALAALIIVAAEELARMPACRR